MRKIQPLQNRNECTCVKWWQPKMQKPKAKGSVGVKILLPNIAAVDEWSSLFFLQRKFPRIKSMVFLHHQKVK